MCQLEFTFKVNRVVSTLQNQSGKEGEASCGSLFTAEVPMHVQRSRLVTNPNGKKEVSFLRLLQQIKVGRWQQQ